jgi:O-antigen ligase
MSPNTATLIFVIGMIGLFYFDRGEKSRVSKALWIPTVWLFFCLSRSASEWLGVTPPADLANSYVEGSPLDAAVFEVLEIVALIVVISRRHRVGAILRNNWPICLFFAYAALSICWSEYPFVTLKHLIKGIGDLMMVLIVLSEKRVADAIKCLFTRIGFLLLPLSVLFIKYYPPLGRKLNLSWAMEPVGVATQKNGLGELCNVVGLALLWRLRHAYNDREDPKRNQRLLALGACLVMVVWLLWECNSMTSICAFSLASALMLLSKRPAFRFNPAFVHLLVVSFLACTIYALFFQSSGSLIQGLGRNPTLTGRTDIWQMVLSIHNSRLFGAGYESFWLGSRLQEAWQAFPGLKLNEAHNGYVEILLTLGWTGGILLGVLIATGYRNVFDAYRRDPDLGSLRMAFFLAAITTGLTEAAFRYMGPPWIVFLLATAAVPAFVARKGGRSRVGRPPVPWRAEDSHAVPEEVPVGYLTRGRFRTRRVSNNSGSVGYVLAQASAGSSSRIREEIR